MPDLRGKVTIITGASSGIGRGTAVEFAQLGAHLALTGRNQENLQATAKACVEAGAPQDKILLVTGDICDEQVQKNLVEQTVQKFGRIDVLVNNAGIGGPVTIETIDMATYDRIMNVNVRSVVTLTQLCIPHLAKTQVRSALAFDIRFYVKNIERFYHILSLKTISNLSELASKQIRVNSVNPGIIPTEIFKRAGRTEEECAKLLEHSKSAHALGRNGEVSEVAKTIAFLASSDASFITGAQVPVDGGRHAMCPR
uniref:Uncharacterized protein n=1 Tax=Branchiostoma floridae TaxID=7739 RepID=C3Y897_BRAFL|eukprot:XP_002607324.1 hypothetical protein BRAFLDRAFT_276598 [Branchiostoma floridae]